MSPIKSKMKERRRVARTVRSAKLCSERGKNEYRLDIGSPSDMPDSPNRRTGIGFGFPWGAHHAPHHDQAFLRRGTRSAKASHREIEVRSHGPSEILEISYEARFLPIALAGSVSPPVCCTDDVVD